MDKHFDIEISFLLKEGAIIEGVDGDSFKVPWPSTDWFKRYGYKPADKEGFWYKFKYSKYKPVAGHICPAYDSVFCHSQQIAYLPILLEIHLCKTALKIKSMWNKLFKQEKMGNES